MEYFAGIAIAFAAVFLGRSAGFDHDRAFYPVIMIVTAGYYVLFALAAGADKALVPETLASAGFVVLAVVGFRRSLWFVVGALVAHGVFDVLHGHVIDNPGVPIWWPAFCAACDIAMAALVALLLTWPGKTGVQLGLSERSGAEFTTGPATPVAGLFFTSVQRLKRPLTGRTPSGNPEPRLHKPLNIKWFIDPPRVTKTTRKRQKLKRFVNQ